MEFGAGRKEAPAWCGCSPSAPAWAARPSSTVAWCPTPRTGHVLLHGDDAEESTWPPRGPGLGDLGRSPPGVLLPHRVPLQPHPHHRRRRRLEEAPEVPAALLHRPRGRDRAGRAAQQGGIIGAAVLAHREEKALRKGQEEGRQAPRRQLSPSAGPSRGRSAPSAGIPSRALPSGAAPVGRGSSRGLPRGADQPACKPGSVISDHPSRVAVADDLQPVYPGTRAGALMRSLSDLAPGGVYRAGLVTETAVVSYTTLSPLPPRPRARARSAHSVALSRGSLRVGVTHHRAGWSRTFLGPAAYAARTQLPTDWSARQYTLHLRLPLRSGQAPAPRRAEALAAPSSPCPATSENGLMLILLPPSETKTRPAERASSLDLDEARRRCGSAGRCCGPRTAPPRGSDAASRLGSRPPPRGTVGRMLHLERGRRRAARRLLGGALRPARAGRGSPRRPARRAGQAPCWAWSTPGGTDPRLPSLRLSQLSRLGKAGSGGRRG